VDRWFILRDILATGTGLGVIWVQVFSPRPSDVLLATGLALTAPSIAAHARTLLGGHPGPSSPPSPPPGPPPPGPPREVTGEPATPAA